MMVARPVMTPAPPRPRWLDHFVYGKHSLKTTWKLRLLIVVFMLVAVLATRTFWAPFIGQSLVCRNDAVPSDAIVVENFEPDYFVFERAARLQRQGFSRSILVPTKTSEDYPEIANTAARRITTLMAELARIENIEIVPVREIEPISLNVAYQMRDLLVAKRLKSIILVTSGFRSRRSSLVYRAVLTPAGIDVHCSPIIAQHYAEKWTTTWHGIEDAIAQIIKLEYYRLYVLPTARGGLARGRAASPG
jgi:hypothetical protein